MDRPAFSSLAKKVKQLYPTTATFQNSLPTILFGTLAAIAANSKTYNKDVVTALSQIADIETFNSTFAGYASVLTWLDGLPSKPDALREVYGFYGKKVFDTQDQAESYSADVDRDFSRCVGSQP